jgi:putative phage-type endonuclease
MCSAYVELLTPEQATPDNPQWHKLRREGVSASEIAAVLGISPWESPFSLYWSKVNDWHQAENAYMSAGKRAESVIADWYADEHPDVVVRRSGLYANAERLWQLATPDRLVSGPCVTGGCDGSGAYASGRLVFECPDCDGKGGPLLALLECKYEVYSWDGWGEDGTDDIPVHYRAQALWQLDVMGVDEVHVAAWHGADFRCYRVRRDEKDLRVMRASARTFLDRLAAGEPPDIDSHTATVGALKRIHPSIEDRDIEVPAEFAEGYRRARQLARRTEAVLDRYEARARELLGNGRRLLCNGHLVCSRSIYDQSGSMVELDSLDADPPTVDRLNPGRATSYLTPKGKKK